MKRVVCLLGGVLIGVSGSARVDGEQGTGCLRPLTTVTAPERTYANVNVSEFDGRVYLYAPEIRSSSRGSFDPFQLWLVEGVYGRPFVQTSGPMDQAAFDRLRNSPNVRATAVNVGRNGESTRVTVSRQSFLLEIGVSVSSGGADTVTAKLCR